MAISEDRAHAAAAGQSAPALRLHQDAGSDLAGRLRPPPPRARGGATVWALCAIAWILIAGQAVIRWVADSEQFAPAPIQGPDEMADWRMVALRIFEGTSTLVLLWFLWFCVYKPYRERGCLSLDGKFVLGGLCALGADAFLNINTYLFAWNGNNIDMGVWSASMPFHNEEASSRYAESLLWGPPMYVYFCAGVAIVACRYAVPLRAKYPNMSNATLFSIVFAAEFAFDFVVEVLAIRLTHGYAYAQTYGPLTIWDGQVHQFPLYESFLVASLGCLFTWMRMRAMQDPRGLSPVEQGFERWPVRLQPAVRTLAVIGFCCVSIVFIYHLTFNWLGLVGTSMADLPSYLLAG
ncbi:MAG: spirocyclase AveC family protein [Sporichthyaceae bacterium]